MKELNSWDFVGVAIISGGMLYPFICSNSGGVTGPRVDSAIKIS